MFIVLMGVCESERCHAMPSRTMLASRQVCWSCGQVRARHSGASLVESTSSSGVLPASTSLCLCRRSPVAGSRQGPLPWPCCCMQANANKQSWCSDHTYLRSNLPCRKVLQSRRRPDDQPYRKSSWYRPTARVSAMERSPRRRRVTSFLASPGYSVSRARMHLHAHGMHRRQGSQ